LRSYVTARSLDEALRAERRKSPQRHPSPPHERSPWRNRRL
jgi:hypothetical protein